MTNPGLPSRPSLFSRTLRECRQLYVGSGEQISLKHGDLVRAPGEYVQLMDDLHRGLVLKIYLTVCEADNKWSQQERLLAEVLCHHLWGTWLEGDQLRDTMKRCSEESKKLAWDALLGPFRELAPLRGRVGELETLVTRLANVIARCDGALCAKEQAALQEIERHVRGGLPIGDAADSPKPELPSWWTEPSDNPSAQESEQAVKAPAPSRASAKAPPRRGPGRNEPKPEHEPPKVSLQDALDELEQLIGLGGIKHEVRSLANFLTLQAKREAAGLPKTEISLHMVFTGNPGTGKTTVARIVGKVFGALGVLAKGHLVETDRSGLVAEYAGQTAPRTNAKIDEAIDGLLFIDEAYSLVAAGSEDPYGREATQTLLKRAEDDRDRVVVILAGYPDEMQTLLLSNPGLSSRFSRRLEFEDYSPLELSQIFGLMCKKNHYELTRDARLKIMVGLKILYDGRTRHFGNGRESRNLFEHAVRRMANRLANEAEISPEQLVTLVASDIELTGVPAALMSDLDESRLTLRLACAACKHSKGVPLEFLGKSVKCPKCDAAFVAEWGELEPTPA